MSLKWLQTSDGGKGFSVKVVGSINGKVEWRYENAVGYIPGTNMIEVHRNGVLLDPEDYIELDGFSIQLEFEDKPGDEYIIRYIPSEMSLGDLKIISDPIELSRLKNMPFNSIAFSISDRSFYRMGGSGWEPFVVPFTTKNIGLLFEHETVTLTGQTINLQTINIPVGMGAALVFVDGVKKDFIEVDNKTIQLIDTVTPGQKAEVLVASNDPWEDLNSHTVDYVYEGEDIREEVVSVNNQVVKRTLFEYSGDNITKETIVKNGRTITKNYFYNTAGDIIRCEVVV